MESGVILKLDSMIIELVALKASMLQVLESNADPSLRRDHLLQDVLIVHYIMDIDLCIDLLQRALVVQKRMLESATHIISL
jgi:hypothetical protein